MQVVVSFPDSGFPDVMFEATIESLVTDAAQAAADEWDVDAEFLEMSFEGTIIPLSSRLISHGVEAGSQLTVSLLQVFGFQWLMDQNKNKKLTKHLSRIGAQTLSLDTPSFATNGEFYLDMEWLPENIEVLLVNPDPSVTSATWNLPHYDFQKYPTPKIDLSGLRYITSIGDGFLPNCSSIVTLDVSCLSNITSIGDYFLCGCLAISSLDLTSFDNVTSVGDYFLGYCSSLTTLDLASFSKLTTIGSLFLCSCLSLSEISLPRLNNITTIDDGFLEECSSLSALNLAGLNNVASIGSCFLERCSSLLAVDLTGCNKVTRIGSSFLGNCSSLSSLDLKGFSNVERIDCHFLHKCSSLTEVNVTGLSPTSEVRRKIEEMGIQKE